MANRLAQQLFVQAFDVCMGWQTMSAVEVEDVDTVPGVGKEHWAEGGAVVQRETETAAPDALGMPQMPSVQKWHLE